MAAKIIYSTSTRFDYSTQNYNSIYVQVVRNIKGMDLYKTCLTAGLLSVLTNSRNQVKMKEVFQPGAVPSLDGNDRRATAAKHPFLFDHPPSQVAEASFIILL